MTVDEFIDLYWQYKVMVRIHNQEQKTHAAKLIAETAGISDNGMAPYDKRSPFVGLRSSVKASGSYGIEGVSDIVIDYDEFIEMIECSDNESDSSAILDLL